MSITIEETNGFIKGFKHIVATIELDGIATTFMVDPLLIRQLDTVISFINEDQQSKCNACVSMYNDIYTMIVCDQHMVQINTYHRLSDEYHLIISSTKINITSTNKDDITQAFKDLSNILEKK